jgi:hypothetical protein
VKVGISVECRAPQGSVAFQAQVDTDEHSVRHVRKELQPQEIWTFRTLAIPQEKMAFFALQSTYGVTVVINGVELLLSGQMASDFGVLAAQQDKEVFFPLPFSGDFSEMKLINETDKLNTVVFMFGEVPEPRPTTPSQLEHDPSEELTP